MGRSAVPWLRRHHRKHSSHAAQPLTQVGCLCRQMGRAEAMCVCMSVHVWHVCTCGQCAGLGKSSGCYLVTFHTFLLHLQWNLASSDQWLRVSILMWYEADGNFLQEFNHVSTNHSKTHNNLKDIFLLSSTFVSLSKYKVTFMLTTTQYKSTRMFFDSDSMVSVKTNEILLDKI